MTGRRGRHGAIYLVCWAATPYERGTWPCHYLGFCYPDDDPDRADPAILAEIAGAMLTRINRRYLTPEQAAGTALRIAQHRAGRGARLLAVIREAEIEFTVARIWSNATEGHEKALKDLNDRAGLCPLCHPGTRAGLKITPKRFRRRQKVRPAPEALAA